MKPRLKSKIVVLFGGLVACFLIISSGSAVFATNYGTGDYGECPYSASSAGCSISISNNGFTLFLNITPSSSGSCTIQSDLVTVSTYDPGGYTLTLINTSTSPGLYNVLGTGSNIPATSGTSASPVALSDTWGYRVDSWGNFGSGPTSTETNGAPNSSLHFAKTEPSNGTADTIAQTSTLNTSSNTTIWYGVCLDNSLSIPTGTYSSTIEYTATAN